MNHKDRILIVDDEAGIRNFCMRVLKQADFHVVSVESADRAVELLARPIFDFDLVISDIRMPGKNDGKNLLEQIKAKSPNTDVILMTADPTVESAMLALKEGVYDYLIKPFDPEQLVSVVGRCLEKRHLKTKLEQAYRELRILNDSREMVLQLLIHDMKNPLSGIMGNVQILLMDQPSPWQQEALSDILFSSRRLHQMVLNLLEIGKMEEGRMVPNYQTVNAGSLFNEITQLMKGQFESKKIKFSCRIDPADLNLFVDRVLLSHALQNLLDNSLAYTFEGGTVELSAQAEQNAYLIRVKDSGQEVEPKNRQNIFTRYGRIADHGARSNRGLGLYFCKLALEAHDGQIELEDCAEGCTFLITLPGLKTPAGFSDANLKQGKPDE